MSIVLRIHSVLLLIVVLSSSLEAQVSALNVATEKRNSACSAVPRTVTLLDALALARAQDPTFRGAVTATRLAHEDKVQAIANILPTINYTSAFLYTQGNGASGAIFIANNGVHEYLAQTNAHETINMGGGMVAEYRRATAAEALARAKQEVAARGLVVVVVQNFYSLISAERGYANAQQAAAESEWFLTITQQLERGGEAAHADVIKAQIQSNSTMRDLQEAQLGIARARLNLAVLLFPAFDENFTAVDDIETVEALPSFEETVQMAAKGNPELHAALAAVQVANYERQVAIRSYYPTLGLDVWYGIDAGHFAIHEPNGTNNLGYSAAASLIVPVWTWGSIRSKVKQAEVRRQQAEFELSAAQRTAIADVHSFYNEAQTSGAELDILRQSADLAAESLRLINLRYKAGESSALEVVDAQNTLVQTRNAYVQGAVRYRVAIAMLQTITGPF